MDSPAPEEDDGSAGGGAGGGGGCARLLCQTRLRFQKDVTRVAVNSTGTLAALCGKKLSVIGLTAPFAVARELTLANKAVPLSAVFSPHSHQASFVGCHAGQSVSLFNLNDARSPLQATLPHQRNVRSFSWSLFDPSLVASCAADNAIHLWDLRDLKNVRAASTLKARASFGSLFPFAHRLLRCLLRGWRACGGTSTTATCWPARTTFRSRFGTCARARP
jgi:WD40 repeat protein